VYNIRIEVEASIKTLSRTRDNENMMTALTKTDPHAFSPTNKIVLRLQFLLRQRQVRDVTLSTNDKYRLYKIVREAESELLTRLQSGSAHCELQAGEESPLLDAIRRQMPLSPIDFGWRSEAPDADAQFRAEALKRIIEGRNLDGMDFSGPGSIENHQQELTDMIWLHIESLLTLVSQLRAANDWNGIYHAVAQYLRVVTNKPIGTIIAKVYGRVKELINGIMSTDGLQSGEDEQENPFSRFRHWLSVCDTVGNHPVVQKIKKIFYYLMSYSLLERFGITFNTFWYTKA